MSDFAGMKLVTRPCPVCASTDESRVFAEASFDLTKLDEFAFASRKFPEYMHYRLVECGTCDVLHATPLPTLEELSAAYHNASFDSREEARYAARVYGSFLPAIRSSLPDTAGALDIGAGDGAFLEELLEEGFSEVTGVEPSAAPIAAAPPHIRSRIRHELFIPGHFKPASLSLVTCFQTLEHVSDPLALCRAAWQLLKPGGALFIIVHNRRSMSARLMGMKSPIYDIEHLQLYSPDSIRQLFSRAGFDGVQVKTVYNTYPLHYWTKLFPLPKSLKLGLLSWMHKLKVAGIPLKIPAGNIAAVGFKKP